MAKEAERRIDHEPDQETAPSVPWRVEGTPEPPDPGPSRRRGLARIAVLVLSFLILLGVNWLAASSALGPPSRASISYTFLRQQASADAIKEITATGDTIEGQFRRSVAVPGAPASQKVTLFATQRPSFANDNLFQLLEKNGVVVNAKLPGGPPLWERLLVGLLPTLLLVGLLLWGARRLRSATGLGGAGGLGRSRARRYDPATAPRVTFQDVAGIDEVLDDVSEIVDFLQDSDRYRRLGARMPRGVLLTGPPGTGKTLLARAVAGEARVPFYSVSRRSSSR